MQTSTLARVTPPPTLVAEQPYRPFGVRVLAIQDLCPTFRRITLEGAELSDFADNRYDQRIKLIFPTSQVVDSMGLPTGLPASGIVSGEGDWHAQWRALPDDVRPAMRTYTVRAARPHLGQVDVDFVLHGTSGPASRWASAAQPGDQIFLIGPNARYDGPASGVEWRPPAHAQHLILAGDETATPAICSILEELAAQPPVMADGSSPSITALLEVPTAHDALNVAAPRGSEIRWLPRQERSGAESRPHGELLTSAVRSAAMHSLGESRPARVPEDVDIDHSILWEVPSDTDVKASLAATYVWLAGEAGTVKSLRRRLVGDLGMDRSAVAFMGYWRAGRAELT